MVGEGVVGEGLGEGEGVVGEAYRRGQSRKQKYENQCVSGQNKQQQNPVTIEPRFSVNTLRPVWGAIPAAKGLFTTSNDRTKAFGQDTSPYLGSDSGSQGTSQQDIATSNDRTKAFGQDTSPNLGSDSGSQGTSQQDIATSKQQASNKQKTEKMKIRKRKNGDHQNEPQNNEERCLIAKALHRPPTSLAQRSRADLRNYNTCTETLNQKPCMRNTAQAATD